MANSRERYGSVAIALHWGMAGLLIVLIAGGTYMVLLPDVGFDTVKITLILSHKALGMLALALLLPRLLWRWTQQLPGLAHALPQWQQVAARFAHLCFYALMFVVPLTGWLMSSAGGYPLPFFGWFEVPDLIDPNETWFRLLITVHRWLAYALLGLLAMHVGAALYHHLQLRDDTLRRMLPDA